MKKNIKLAKHAGFCYGVKRAVLTTKKLKAENKDKEIFVLGELIHNSHVINELSSLGIHTVDELPCNQTGVCIIRSHGAAPEVFDNAKQKGYEIVDLTCPDVKKVQQKAIQLVQEGFLLIIVGKPEHPEVCAIKANAQKTKRFFTWYVLSEFLKRYIGYRPPRFHTFFYYKTYQKKSLVF